MKFFEKIKISSSNKKDKTVLFVCVENAGRSQMVEGFFKKYASHEFKTLSAGTKPVPQINPIVVQAMKEVGIDISKQKSKMLIDEMIRESDKVINMLQKLQLLLKDKLDKNTKIFLAELVGTFIVIVFATGSVVLDAKMNGALGLPFIAIAPAIAVAIGIYLFGKISMAHFNPAVTVGFLITNHLQNKQQLFITYIVEELIGALLASIF
ncbi:MAG: aquaporin, partial [Nitrososphaeraceae archaeon]